MHPTSHDCLVVQVILLLKRGSPSVESTEWNNTLYQMHRWVGRDGTTSVKASRGHELWMWILLLGFFLTYGPTDSRDHDVPIATADTFMPSRVLTYVLQELEVGQRKCRICYTDQLWLNFLLSFAVVCSSGLVTIPLEKQHLPKRISLQNMRFLRNFFKWCLCLRKYCQLIKLHRRKRVFFSEVNFANISMAFLLVTFPHRYLIRHLKIIKHPAE